MKISTITLFLILSIITPCTTAIEQPKKMNAVQNIWSRMYHGVRSGFKKTKDYFYSSRLFAGYHSTPKQKEAALQKLEELLIQKEVYNDELTATTDETKRTALYKDVADLNAQIHEQKIILGQEWTTTRELVYGGTAAAGLALGGMKFLNLKTDKPSVPHKPTDTLPGFNTIEFRAETKLTPEKLSLNDLFDYGNKINEIHNLYEKYKEGPDKTRPDAITEQLNKINLYIGDVLDPAFEARGYTWDGTEKTWIWNNPILIEFSKLKFKTKEELTDPKMTTDSLLTYARPICEAYESYKNYTLTQQNKDAADINEKTKQRRELYKYLIILDEIIAQHNYEWDEKHNDFVKK